MIMREQDSNQSLKRKALLGVLLLILVSLAGILVLNAPLRTQTASAATSPEQIVKAIEDYQNQSRGRFPDGWDTLYDGTGLATFVQGSIAPKTSPSNSTAAANPWMAMTPLTAAEVTALSNAGINTLYDFAPGAMGSATGPADPTIYPYGPNNLLDPTPVKSATPTVAVLTPAALNQLGLNLHGKFVVFGLGSCNSMIGRTLVKAPIMIPDLCSCGLFAGCFYARMGVIFQLGDCAGGQNSTYTTLPQAALAGTLNLSHDSNLTDGKAHILPASHSTSSSKMPKNR